MKKMNSDLCVVLFVMVITGIFGVSVIPALAADQERMQQQIQTQTQEQEQIYGSQLMAPHERTEYRERMRAARTAEEREQIRMEHHERMKERAKERGVTLPDEPPETGMGRGMSPGGGMGGGMGGGGGMGPGGGKR